jgi:hypothetical protein
MQSAEYQNFIEFRNHHPADADMLEDNNDNDNVFRGGNQNQPGGLRRAHLQGRNLNEDVSLNEEDLLDLEGLAQFDASSNLLDQPNNLMTKASGASVIPQAHRPLRDNTFDITNGNTVDNFLLSNPTRQMQMAQQFSAQQPNSTPEQLLAHAQAQRYFQIANQLFAHANATHPIPQHH